MLKSKLIDLFSTLDKSEFKEFGKYMEGTSYRKTSKVFVLYNYIVKQFPDFPEKKMEKEVVAKKVLSDQKNAPKQMLDLMTRLTGVLEDFLIKKELELNKTQKNFLLLDVLKRRKLDKMFFQKIGSIEKDWGKKRPPGIEQLYNEFKLAHICLSHPNYEILPEMPIRSKEIIEKADKFYFATKLNLGLSNYFNSETFSKKDDHYQYDYLLDQMLVISKEKYFLNNPHIQLFGTLLDSFEKKHFLEFHFVKQKFEDNIEKFDDSEKRDLLNSLVLYWNSAFHNDCVTLLDLFNLYKFGVENNIIFEDGFIEKHQFIHITIIGCTVKKLEWVENFIKTNGKFIAIETREDTINLCLANLYFSRKEYDEVLSLLATLKFQDSFFGIQARQIQLQVYYEIEEYEELFFNLVKSFTAFLNRNDDYSESFKKPWLNFIRLAKKLQMSKNNFDGDNSKILAEIESEQSLHCRLWLTEKASLNK